MPSTPADDFVTLPSALRGEHRAPNIDLDGLGETASVSGNG